MGRSGVNLMARPRLQLDEEQIHKLAAINCSLAEIGAVVGCDVSTLTRRYASVIEKGREHGKSSLKKKMYEIAMGGNVTMCIWLSKQMLGYTDKIEQTTEMKRVAEEVNRYKALTPEQLAKEMTETAKKLVETPAA
jgi:hypothetical protein